MTTRNSHDELEIQEIISSIKRTVRESLRMDSSSIAVIHNHLLKLQDHLAYMDNTQDLSCVVSDFIGSLTNLHGLFNNHLPIKFLLKSNVDILEKEFLNFRQTADCYTQLLFVPDFSFCRSNEEG